MDLNRCPGHRVGCKSFPIILVLSFLDCDVPAPGTMEQDMFPRHHVVSWRNALGPLSSFLMYPLYYAIILSPLSSHCLSPHSTSSYFHFDSLHSETRANNPGSQHRPLQLHYPVNQPFIPQLPNRTRKERNDFRRNIHLHPYLRLG